MTRSARSARRPKARAVKAKSSVEPRMKPPPTQIDADQAGERERHPADGPVVDVLERHLRAPDRPDEMPDREHREA